jgi:cytochrome c556
VISDMAKGKTPFDAAKATSAARDLNATAKNIPDLFNEAPRVIIDDGRSDFTKICSEVPPIRHVRR